MGNTKYITNDLLASYTRGKTYNSLRLAPGGDRATQIATAQHNGKQCYVKHGHKTAKLLADELGLTEGAIRRDYRFFCAVNTIAKYLGHEIRENILHGKYEITRDVILNVAECQLQDMKQAFAGGANELKELARQYRNKRTAKRAANRHKSPLPGNRPTELQFRATLAYLTQLEEALSRIGITAQTDSFTNAIRNEIEHERRTRNQTDQQPAK